ncbi:MAG: hypothetical protein HQ519_04290 [Planctomycetes bacterium]|nr:hypothetical protein [Planctomycetota bacterium]
MLFLTATIGALLFAASSTLAATPLSQLPASAPSGEHLVAKYQCLSCHEAEPAVQQRIGKWQAPALQNLSKRVVPGWVLARLFVPHTLGEPVRMPHFRVGSSIADQVTAASELTQFLYPKEKPFEFVGVGVSSEMIAEGGRLFETVGCAPCHQDQLKGGGMDQKYSVASLRDVLLDPLAVWPSGAMPDSHLTEPEATALAAWILRESQKTSEVRVVPGLRYQVFRHNNWPQNDAVDWSQHQAVAAGTADTVHANYGGHKEQYGLVFEGYFQALYAGEYRFYSASDDGSELFINGERIVANLGMHPKVRLESEAVTLKAGMHAIRITFFEQSGGEELEAGWRGPKSDWSQFKADDLWHSGVVPMPLKYAELEHDEESAQRGARRFADMGCALCHTDMGVKSKYKAKRWEDLDIQGSGCVPINRKARLPGVPIFKFEDGELRALQTVLQNRSSLLQPLPSAQIVRREMDKFGCLNCHSSGDVGGPNAATQQYFTSTDDLGDEGRFPPDLSDAGEKFNPEWLHTTLHNGTQIRPAMVTRMPSFGPESQVLATAMETPVKTAGPTSFSEETVNAGAQLVGATGLSCIICHGASGYPSIGIQGPDLSDMQHRLRPAWFKEWMRSPSTHRPGTRMPDFWFNGKSGASHILEGEMDAQINAIWQYMSLGHSAPLPFGLVTNRNEYDLIPVDRPLYFGAFMDGLSARVLTVGFPQRVNLAFDQHNVRMGLAWQGEFMNAKGTWQGRAGQLEKPAGNAVIPLPPGPLLAQLENGQSPWPEGFGKVAGWRYKGHLRDERGYPTFRFQKGDIVVSEKWTPEIGLGGIGFFRHVEVTSPTQSKRLYLRIASNTTAEVQFSFPNDDAMFRSVAGSEEILIPLTFKADGNQFRAQTSIQMIW